MFGTVEAKALAAKGLGELVTHTSEQALKPYVVKITGPLIRIVGDRFPGPVKRAIVDTLHTILVKGGVALKPFLPQLQTTYVKCLGDPSDVVRQKAAESLGTLVRLPARTDTLISELVGSLSNNADRSIQLATSAALGEVLLNLPQPCNPNAQDKILQGLSARVFSPERSRRDREVAAWALGVALRRHLPLNSAVEFLRSQVMSELLGGGQDEKHGAARVLACASWMQPPQLETPPAELSSCLIEIIESQLPSLFLQSEPVIIAAGAAVLAGAGRLYAAISRPFESLTKCIDMFTNALHSTKVKWDPVSTRELLVAMWHFGTALTSVRPPGTMEARLAIAVLARGTSYDDQEVVEKALGALLSIQGAHEATAKASLDHVSSFLDDAAAKALRSTVSKRMTAIIAHRAMPDAPWDI